MEFDAAVIGASTAGLYLARELASVGKRVALFEQHNELNHARRTYIITTALYRFLDDIPGDLIENEISTMQVHTRSARVEIPLKNPDLVMERGRLIQHLYRQAREAGVEFYLGHRFQGFEVIQGKTRLVLARNGSILEAAADVVVGADGVASQVARKADLSIPEQVPLIQAEINLPEGWNPRHTRVWFDAQSTPYFYWLIPESDQQAVVGLIGNPGQDVRKALDEFMKIRGYTPLAYQAGKAALHAPSLVPHRKWGDTDIYLVGDAAGHVKVTTVGGTVTGLWGARAAARSLSGEGSYVQETRSLNRELDIHWLIRGMLHRMDDAGYDRLVDAVQEPVKRFLGRYDRDEMAFQFWKLIFLQPKFIPLGLRLLLRPNHHSDHKA